MKRTTVAWAALLAGAVLAPIPPAFASGFDAAFPGVDGEVFAQYLLGDTLLVGGSFQRAFTTATGACLEFDAARGAPRHDWPMVIGGVWAATDDGHGGWFLGGLLKSVAGIARTGLAHIRADGTLDLSTADADGIVYALARSGDTLFIGGEIRRLGGQTRTHLAALDVRTGAPLTWAPQSDGAVRALCASGGKLFVGGYFGHLAGAYRPHLGAFDIATGALLAWNPRASAAVYALAATEETVYAGGAFLTVADVSRQYVAAFGATTGELLPWNPGTSNSVSALAAAEGEVYVGGAFSTAAGQPRARIARFSSATGLLDPWAPAFNGFATAIAVAGNQVYVGGGSLVAIDRLNAGLVQPELPAFYGYVRGLSAQAGRLLVVGEMAVSGSETRKGLAAFDTRTRALLPWSPDINGAVRAITARDGVLWLGGDFTQVDGAGRSRLAALDAATCTLLPQAPACNGRVLALALSNGTLYAGGDIALANGTARSRLAAFDAATGALLPWNPGANYSVKAFALGESTLFVGGEFTSVAGVPRTRLAAFDLTNGDLLPWAPTANIAVRALALDRDQLFIGGQFTQVNGQPRLQLAALDASSGVLRAWVPDAAFAARLGPIVNGLAVIGGSVVAAGDGSSYEPACQCNWPRGFALGLDIATGAATTAMADFESAAHSVVGMPGSAFVAGQFGREYAPGWGNCAHLLRMHVAGADPMFQGTVLEPIAGRPLAIGSVHRFEWRSEGAVFGAQSADLYLSRGGPLGPWEPIAIGVSGRDSYDWTVAGPDAAQAYLWVDVRDAAGRIASDVSDGAFSIGAAALDAPPNTPANTVALEGPLPNPLRGRGTLRYVVPRTGRVSLGVFDILGREVRALVAGNREAGSHSVALGALPRGLYFARLVTGDGTISKRFVVLD